MPRQTRSVMDGLIPKIRKRGCSSSSSSSSKVHHYRLKRAILVGKNRGGVHGHAPGVGVGGSRSSTPVPSWKMTPLRSAIESPKNSQAGRSRPVSARRLAATLWEMHEMPTPRAIENSEDEKMKKKKMSLLKREKLRSVHSGSGSVSGSLPPHLCDPSHSPVSEMDRSGIGNCQRRASSVSHRHKSTDQNGGILDSLSSASQMEIEVRSRAQTPSGSVIGVRNRLKDVSNALTTSKELLKIINRIWAQADQPSSSMSLVSALHAELERARLQVNQLIQEQRSDHSDINYLLKCFAEEKAAWKFRERQSVETAIESFANELEVERKLRRRFESLNKKLGSELAEAKSSLTKTAKELESEKRARDILEQVCNELARDIGDDRAEVEELKRESAKVHEEVEQEREMLQLADRIREERVQMKLSEAKHQFEEKSTAVDKLRKQLESFLRKGKGNKKGSGRVESGNDKSSAALSSKAHVSSHQNEEKEDDGEVEDVIDCEEGSGESDLHSIELNRGISSKMYKSAYGSAPGRESGRISVDNEIKRRNSVSGQLPRKSASLQRSISDAVEWGTQGGSTQNLGDGIDWDRLNDSEKQAQRKGYVDEIQRFKAVKGLRDQALTSSRIGPLRELSSPTRQLDQAWPLRDPCGSAQERSSTILGNSHLKSRLGELSAESQNIRRSKR